MNSKLLLHFFLAGNKEITSIQAPEPGATEMVYSQAFALLHPHLHSVGSSLLFLLLPRQLEGAPTLLTATSLVSFYVS